MCGVCLCLCVCGTDPVGFRAHTLSHKQDHSLLQAGERTTCMRTSCMVGTIQTLGTEPNSSLTHLALSAPSYSPARPTIRFREPGSPFMPTHIPPALAGSLPWMSSCCPSPHSHFCLGLAVFGLDECSSLQISLPVSGCTQQWHLQTGASEA